MLDHIAALRSLSRHDVRLFNPCGLGNSLALDLAEFDAVVIHYSLVCISDHHLPLAIREKIRCFQGLKIHFIQDEYRWVDRVTAEMGAMGIDILFTCLPLAEAERVYRPRLPNVRLLPTLTGYVPEGLLGAPATPLAERPIDIGYRSRELPYWLGDLARDKVRIAVGVLDRAATYGLRVDIKWKEAERLYGQAWIDFLSRCRATLGTGSGSSVTDFDGSIESAVGRYLAGHPDASYEEVHREVLAEVEGNVRFDVVSPRVFEAIALRTALVQFPGDYSGVVRPDEHYLVLERDFSNFDVVVAKLKDDRFVSAMTERAYRDVVASGRYSYKALVDEFDAEIFATSCSRRSGPALRYAAARLVQWAAVDRLPVRTTRWAIRSSGLERRSPVLARFVRDPRSYAVKGGAAVALALRSPGRLVLLKYLSDSGCRRLVPIDRLLEDLLELDAASRVARERRLDISVTRSRGSIRFRTLTSPARARSRPRAWPAEIKSINWDNRASGVTTEVGDGVQVAVGEAGITEFNALVALGRRHPATLRRLLAGLFEATTRVAGPSATITRRLPGPSTPTAVGRNHDGSSSPTFEHMESPNA